MCTSWCSAMFGTSQFVGEQDRFGIHFIGWKKSGRTGEIHSDRDSENEVIDTLLADINWDQRWIQK
jgi:hypothetical protein